MADELAPGTLLGGRYRISGEAGHGNLAVVHVAMDERTGATVAVKVLRRVTSDLAAARARFAEEQATLATLDHPGVVRLLDADVMDSTDRPWAVHSLVRGRTLEVIMRSALATGTLAPVGWAVDRALDLLDVLDHVHGRGWVHGDVSPANVMVTPLDRLVLLDIGACRPGAVSTAPVTPEYAAPERLDAGPLTPAADVYAASAVLHAALTGATPHRPDGPTGASAPLVRSLRHLQPSLPDGLDRAVLAGLSSTPEARPTTAEMVDLLRRQRTALSDLAPAPSSPPEPLPPARTRPIVLAGRDPKAAVPRLVAGPPVGAVPPAVRDASPLPTPRRGAERVSRRQVAIAAVAGAAALVGGGALALRESHPEPRAAGAPSPSVVSVDRSSQRVPAVLGQPRDVAIRLLEGAGLGVGEVRVVDGPHAAGVVVSSLPATGSLTSARSTVRLVVASGMTVVPEVIGLSLTKAKSVLSTSGLAVRWPLDVAASSAVRRSEPAAGARVDLGATITLSVTAPTATPSPTPRDTASPPPTASPATPGPSPSPSPTGSGPQPS